MDRNNIDFPVLIGQTGPLNGQRWVVNETFVIGRDPSCQIVIPDRQVSRFHARLSSSAEGILLEDLGSKNGTHLNGHPVEEPQILEDGDLIQVALVQRFVYLSSDATMPLEGGMAEILREESPLYLDSKSRRVWIRKQEVLPPLSVPQFTLLELLYQHTDRVVSRMELVSAIWGEDESVGVSEQALDALVRRLRDRLSELDPKYTYIITVRGHGLRLENTTH